MKTLILLASLCMLVSNSSIANFLPANKLFASPSVSMMKFSPDGNRVSMITNKDGKRQFSITELESKKQHIVSNFSIAKNVKYYEWINNELLHVATSQGEYFVSLAFTDDSYQAIVKKIPYSGYVAHIFSQTNQVLYAKAKPWESGGFTLHLQSIEDLVGKNLDYKKQIKGPTKRVSYFGYDPQRQHILASMFDEDEKSITIEYRSLSKNKWYPLVTLHETDYEFTPVAFIDDQTLAVLTNKESDRIALSEYNLISKNLGKTLFEHPKYDLISAQFEQTPAGIRPQYVSYYDHGRYTIEYLQNRDKEKYSDLAIKLKDKQWATTAVHEESNQQILLTSASDDPGGFYLYKKDLNELTLLYSLFPDLEGFSFARTEVSQVQVSSDVQIEYYLTRANGKSHDTLLVNPHGGPVGVREDTFFSPTVQFYTNRGFDILQVNFRGSSGFGKKFLEGGKGQFGKAIEQDITASVNQVLVKNSYKNICAMGSSYGGYSSVMLAIQHSDLYDCIVAAYGIYDLPLLYNASNLKVLSQHRQKVAEIVGDYNKDLISVSPAYLVDKIKSPVFLIAGRRDKVAEFEHSNRLNYLLERFDKPVETLFYRSVGHGHARWRGEIHEQLSTLEFLVNTLNLERFWESDLQESDKLLLSNEYMLLADAFTFKDSVDDDAEKAAYYLEKASALGNGRATYNYAVQLADKDQDGSNNQKVIKLYEQADQAQYKNASFALGRLYQEGKKVEQDYAKAHAWFKRAQSLDYGQKADYEIGKAFCLGRGVPRDIDACLTLLSQRTKKENENKEKGRNFIKYTGSRSLLEAFHDIVLFDHFSSAEYQKILDHIKYEFRLDNANLELDVDDLGAFDNYKHLETTHNIVASKYTIFGIQCEIKTTDTFGKSLENIALYYKWTQFNKTGEVIDVVSNILKGREGEWNLKFELPEQTTKPSRFLLEVFDLERNLLFSDTFNVTPN